MSRSDVVAPPTTQGARPQLRATGDAAAAAFSRRIRVIDRIAQTVISVSGIGIICAVLGIGVFLAIEIMPLFAGARVTAGVAAGSAEIGRPIAVLIDEHQEKVAVIGESAEVAVTPLGEGAGAERLPIAELAGTRITAASRVLRDDVLALATDQGTVWIGSVSLSTVFDGRVRTIRAQVDSSLVVDVAPGHRLTALAYREGAQGGTIAAVAEDAHLIVTRLTLRTPLIGPAVKRFESEAIPLPEGARITGVLLNEPATQLIAATTRGEVIRWRLNGPGASELVESVEVVPGAAVTALAYLLGDRSIAIGGEDGSVATWSLVRSEERTDGWRLTRIHPFAPHPAPIAAIAPSARDKGFVTISRDGAARLHYMTSERTLVRFTVDPGTSIAELAPKANGLIAANADGGLTHRWINNPHPEFSWKALFGKVWYEGYARPEHVWQSTGGTDDFEPKFGLVPLIFGTLKGTCYALLFAVPIALFGALYCSQFLDKRLRNPIKSAVEMMAALPSVVLGFVAGVVLAPLVHDHVVAVLAMPAVVPLIAIAGLALTQQIPSPRVKTFVRRHEFWLLVAWVAAGGLAALHLGPWIERIAFSGPFEDWLSRATGARYDQRNSLVVGWVMGFAVIPIIFTICEDAFSAVPRHLVGASLACGASLWQTAWRVVLPAAGSGVFSGIMVGFGRAVGETMIVLMATGNTPVMDWSLFNGFRALSANVAVEIPEAPNGGTLYRILFLSSLLLFLMTSLVNTGAELIRLRLRRRLQGI